MYLIYFSTTFNDFRLPELNSVLELFGYNPNDIYDMYIFMFHYIILIEKIILPTLHLCLRPFPMMSVLGRFTWLSIFKIGLFKGCIN